MIIAFNLYCKIPFSKIHYSNPEIIEMAGIIGRSPSSLALKLVNLASLDPALRQRNISGMKHGSKSDRLIWDEFNENREELIYESQIAIARLKGQPMEDIAHIEVDDLPAEGKEREAIIMARVNQSFFRNVVLSSYENQCCITGIAVPELLIASHIIPWAKDIKNRLNPANGVCLNALHDKAFDNGLITITPDYTIIVSTILKKIRNLEAYERFFLPFNNKKIVLPRKFIPDPEFLLYHNKYVFVDGLQEKQTILS